jgi:hypothetical protein
MFQFTTSKKKKKKKKTTRSRFWHVITNYLEEIEKLKKN